MMRKTARIAIPAALALGAGSIGLAQQGQSPAQSEPELNDSQETARVGLEISLNQLMVASIDHSAHVIWEGESEETLDERDWQILEQHAIMLIGTGATMSMAGTGPLDSEWAADPAWHTWVREYTDAAHSALAAVEAQDQAALAAAGDTLVSTCNGCHAEFKSEIPTEGIEHIPHYDQL